MNDPQQPKFDAYAAGMVAASGWVGPQLAPLVVGYGLIVMGWAFGALVGLYLRRQARVGVGVYLLLSFLLSVLGTGALAAWAADHSDVAASALLAPLSAALAAYVDKVVDLLGELVDKVRAMVAAWQGGRR